MISNPAIDAIAKGIHYRNSFVDWDKAHKDRRADCLRMARTIYTAWELGQTVTEAADRLIVWHQVDNKFDGQKGRTTVNKHIAQEFDDIVMAGVKALAVFTKVK